LRDPEVGLVNCCYRLANPSTLATHWEAVAVNTDFWSGVLQSQSILPLDFAMGAVMVTRREQLDKIGAFESLADYLADDYQLGNRIVRLTGKRIVLCPVVVDCISAPARWHAVWAHQLRWARTIRVSKPGPYAGSILNNGTLWPLLWFLMCPSKWSAITCAVCVTARIVTAQMLQARLGSVRGQLWYWWLVPVKDLLQCVLWAAAISGSHIKWRGQRFRVRRNGKLVPAYSQLYQRSVTAALMTGGDGALRRPPHP
jgi:ceramide glucosyltransferase